MTENQRPPGGAGRTLARSRDERVLAGVCGGLGHYTDIDPVVYRVVLGLLAFAGGVGILLYAAGWLLMPEEGGTESAAERLLRRRFDASTVPALLLAAVGVVVALSFFSHGFGSPTIVLVTVLAMAALVAHRHGVDLGETLRGLPGRLRASVSSTRGAARGAASEPPWKAPPAASSGSSGSSGSSPFSAPSEAAPPPGSPPAAGGAAHDTTAHDTAAAPDPETPYDLAAPRQRADAPQDPATAPHGTGPYGPDAPYDLTVPYHRPGVPHDPGTAPYGTGAPYDPAGPYDLTAPYHLAGPAAYAPPEEPGQRRRREASFLTPLALAVAALVAGVLVALSAAGVADVTLQVALAAVLVAVGLGLVLGTWYGHGRSLFLVGTALCLALVIVTTVSVPLRGGVGDITWRPAATVAQPYRLGVGNATLDLTRLPAAGPYDITASVGIGDLRVRVPRDAAVTVHAHAGTGGVTVAGHRRDGVDVALDRVLTPAGGKEPSATMDLNLQVGVGNLVVTRAPA